MRLPKRSPLASLDFLSLDATAPASVIQRDRSFTKVSQTATGLVASGLAVVNTTAGTIIASFSNAALDPSGTCPILHLVIGPISLDLLGVQVTTSQIVLDITAVPGPGNLLGNLLCAVANLLNQNPLNLSQLAALLTQILALL